MTYTWTRTQSSLPSAMNQKDGIGGVVLNDKMYALGGWNSGSGYGQTYNTVMHSTDGITWTASAKQATWSGRHQFPAVVHNGRIFVLGGDQNTASGYVADCHSWDGLETSDWVEHPTPPWGVRVGHVGFSLGGYLWVGFGQTHDWFGTTPTKFYTDLWRSVDGITWELFSDEMPITPRGYYSSNPPILDDEVYFICGSTYETSDFAYRDYQNDIFAMDGNGSVRQVVHKKQSTLPNMMYHNLAVFDGKLWMLAGFNGADRKFVYMSDDKGKTWTQQPTAPWTARHAGMAITYNDALYFGTSQFTADMWKLTKDIPPPPPPAGLNVGATPTGTTSFASQWTVFDPVASLSPSDVIDSIGLHKGNAGYVTPKIAKIVSGQVLDVVYSGSPQMHNGGGYQNFDIPDFTVPNDGHAYMIGFSFADSAMSFSHSGGARYMKLGDITANGQSYLYFTDGAICTQWIEV